jgi:GT2 family glycosyltransferase/glycosyltransferase involved in cell wall biosynthesis
VDTTRYFSHVEASRFQSAGRGNPGKIAAEKVAFSLSERLAKLGPRSGDSRSAAAPPCSPGNTYDVLIPIYNAYEHLQRCIDSVLRNTSGDHPVYLLDDCSPDSRVLPLLRSYEKADARVRVIEASKNMGFIRNVNRGFALSRNDVVILNSDTEVTGGWLEKMDRCLVSRPDIGIVCPLSNNATILSVPVMNEPNTLPEGMDPEGFGRLVAEVSPRACPEIPTGVGFCMLITRDTLDATGFFDTVFGLGYGEENDLCQRTRAAGRKVVCCDDAYVHHYGEASFRGVDRIEERRAANELLLDRRWPEYRKNVYAFCCANPFRELQERIAARIRETKGPVLPSVLHVIHKFGTAGGTEIHTRNIIDGLASRFHSTVMYPASLPKRWIDLAAREETEYLRVLEVRKESADAQDSFLGAFGDISNDQVESVFSRCLKGGNHRIIHFQHLSDAGSLLLPLIAKRLGCKVVISLHDYYLLCPEYNLVLPGLTRCEKIMADGEDAQCLYCLGAKRRYHGKGMPAFLGDYLAERREVLKKVFEAADVLVAPSEFVRRRFLKAYGEGIRARIVTVPHGMETIPKIRRNRKKNVLNVAFLGNASDRKGVFVLLLAAQILKKMKAKIQFEIFGPIESTP